MEMNGSCIYTKFDDFQTHKGFNIHYTTSEFKYVVNRRGEAESINCIFKLASGVIILSRAARPKKKRKPRDDMHSNLWNFSGSF